MASPERQRYLGDGVYVERVGLEPSTVVLTTDNGLRVTNRIVLEPEVWVKLVRYLEHLGKGEA